MNKKRIMVLSLSAAIIFGTVAAASGSVFAEGTESKWRGPKPPLMQNKFLDKAQFEERAKTEINNLVTSGILTQAEADKVLEYLLKFEPTSNNGVRVNPIDQMTKDGVLTQEKADAVVQVLHPKRDGVFRGMKPKINLSNLVTNGTLTQEEADKVHEYLGKYRPVNKDDENKVNPFEQMVTDGVLTQEKADAVSKIFFASPLDRMKTSLTELVNQGTITQAEADQVIASFEKSFSERLKAEKFKPLEQLVNDGVLTQEKADAIANTIQPKAPRYFEKHHFVNESLN